MILLRCYPRITDWLSAVTHLHLSWIPIQSYGFMVACGFMAAAWIITKELRRREMLGWMPALSHKKGETEWTSDLVGDFVILCAVFGITGSSFFNYLESPASYKGMWDHPTVWSVVSTLFSGLSVYGGMICAGLALLIYSFVKKIKIPHLFDALAYCFILAVGIGRIGCEVSGDGDWGIPHTEPKPAYMPQILWSDTYAHNIANEGVPIPDCKEQYCRELPLPVYPTPIYEFLECLGIFIILHFLRKSLTNKPGMLFFVFAIFIGIQRYAVEQIRSVSDRDTYPLLGHSFRQAELISIALILAGIIGVIGLALYYKKHPAQMPPPLMIEDDETEEHPDQETPADIAAE
ncbi:MAG: diacylglyceryl transferase [Bacteroidetes bacterium]|nr:diacylglyceryl transferase [Bacteroidota bacterium]